MYHYFHIQNENCEGIIPWLKTNNTCPICRTEFPKEEIKEEQENNDNVSNINASDINVNDILNTFLNIPINIPQISIINTIHIDQDGFVNEDIEEAIRRSLE